MVFGQLLSLLLGKVCSALMHALPYLTTFRSPYMQGGVLYHQLDFSAAFDRVNHSGLLLKSIGVGGSVMSICRVPL